MARVGIILLHKEKIDTERETMPASVIISIVLEINSFKCSEEIQFHFFRLDPIFDLSHRIHG